MYWDEQPAARSRPRLVPFMLPTGLVHLETDAGVFSLRGVDPGTEILLRLAPPPPERGAILDLGSGYGPIAISLASQAPGVMVWAVDVNERAVALAARNAERLGLPNVRAVLPDAMPDDVRFAAIYSNPPIRIGKAPTRQIVTDWMTRLEPGAHAYLVVKRSLGSDSFADWLARDGYDVVRLGSKRGYRVLDVRPPRAAVG